MPAKAMSFHSPNTPNRIHLYRYRVKMVRVNTCPIPTEVVKMKPVRDFINHHPVRNTVRAKVPTIKVEVAIP